MFQLRECCVNFCCWLNLMKKSVQQNMEIPLMHTMIKSSGVQRQLLNTCINSKVFNCRLQNNRTNDEHFHCVQKREELRLGEYHVSSIPSGGICTNNRCVWSGFNENFDKFVLKVNEIDIKRKIWNVKTESSYSLNESPQSMKNSFYVLSRYNVKISWKFLNGQFWCKEIVQNVMNKRKIWRAPWIKTAETKDKT